MPGSGRAVADPPRIWTIPAGVPFADALAAELLARAGSDPLALGAVTVLLPNRRAGRALAEAFLRQSGGKALVLPRFRPIGEVDEDELATLAAELGEDDADIPPAVPPLRRVFLLARLVQRAGGAFGERLDQAMLLAEELGRLIDEVQTARLSFDRLKDLVPEAYAAHWQTTLRFLAIVTEHWPRLLAAEGLIDPAERRNRLLDSLARRWRAAPPANPVIAAGSTGSIPATADLLATVAGLPQGELVLPGLDLDSDDATWEAIGETHPQSGLKRLLAHLGVARHVVRPWPVPESLSATVSPARARLLAEALCPPEAVPAWRAAAAPDPTAIAGLVRVDCPSPRAESGVIALRMRQVLDTPGRTAALVTRDRGLAERVAAELARWGVAVDDSAGRPLSVTPVGAFLRLSARAAASDLAPVDLLALFKHPLAAGGLAPGAFRARVRRLERLALRGPRLGPGFAGLRKALRGRQDAADLRAWLRGAARAAGPFLARMRQRRPSFVDLVRDHVAFAEWLAATDASSGPDRLWSGEAGEAAAAALAEVLDAADAVPRLAGDDYVPVLESLLGRVAVRPRYGTHPRLMIWGPLEARLQRADVTILGGLNEGSWPPEAARDPWLSRPMREAFGLPSRERRIGQASHDFVQSACAPEVMLTRSAKADGAPTVAARYLARLEILLSARGQEGALEGESYRWLAGQANLDRPARVEPVPPPRPAPPRAARPRALSVTRIEQWIRDPYATYARSILGLEPLDPLQADPDAAERGTFIHEALDRFVAENPGELPTDAADRLIALGERIAGTALAHPAVRAFWLPRFHRIARWFVAEERERRRRFAATLTEAKGSLTIEAPGGPFRVTAKADRIDLAPDGALAIVDYKTGTVPETKRILAGAAPQLPLEAAIAEAGGFGDLGPRRVGELAHWKLGGGDPPGEIKPVPLDGDLPWAAREGLARLVAAYDDPAMPYLAQPRPALEPAYDDFGHLERREEWLREGVAALPPWRPVGPSAARGSAAPQPDQIAMSDPATSAWIAASAGTGKTKVLTDRVLRLLLEGSPPERILCLTFTKAAAAEMATRIEQALGRWATLPEAALGDALAALAGAPPDAVRIARARRLFAATIEAPIGLRIMTIHGFCQTLLGRFPLEAGVVPGFEVIDERTAAELGAEARDDVLGEGGEAVEIVAGLAAEGSFAKLAAHVLAERARWAEGMRRHGGLDGLILALHRALDVAPGDTVESARAEAVAEGAFDRPGLARAAQALLAGSKTDRERGAGIRAWLESGAEARDRLFRDYSSLFLTGEGGARKKLATNAVEKARAGTRAVLEREAERLLAALERRRRIVTARASAALARVAHALILRYQRLKEARGQLDYEDLVLKAGDLVTRSEQAAWVLYKLDGGLDHILVDEAQDTSPAQWRVVAALVEEFFAGEGASEAARTLFVVGDEKQSIFSFQGADLATVVRVRAELGAKAKAAGRPWLERPLARSYRSGEAVLRAVDSVFAAGEARSGVMTNEAEVHHEVTRIGQAGLVEVWPLVERTAPAPPDPWAAPRAYEEPEEPIGPMAERVAAAIAALVRGDRLESRDRPVRPGDVMVLVQRRGAFQDRLVRALQHHHVPVAGIDRMRLTEPLAVRDLIALGRVLLLPEDDLGLAAVLKGPLVGLTEDELFRVAHGREAGERLWDALARLAPSDPGLEAARVYLADLLDVVDRIGPLALYTGVLGRPPARGAATSGRAAILARLGPEAEDPIDEFLALAEAHGRLHPPVLESFLHWLEAADVDTEVTRDPAHGRDEVQVITVHGAKGLQRPIVFLPDAALAPPNPDSAFAWGGEDGALPLWSGRVELAAPALLAARDDERRRAIEEYHRLLYVALTRAEDRLYIGGWKPGRSAKEPSWHALVSAALAPVAERVAVDGFDGPVLRLAAPQSAPPERSPPTTSPAEISGDLAGELRAPPPPEPPGPAPLVPSRPAVPEPPARTPLGADAAGRRRGRLLHRLLELLPEVEPARRRTAADRLAGRLGRGLPADEIEPLIDAALRILADPAFAPLFAAPSRAEAPIIGRVGDRVIVGQVDRLAVLPDRVLVVDYKSDREAPGSVAAVAPGYLRQMAAYRSVLRRAFADRPVACALLWTETPALMPLPDDVLDRHAP
jgi:ATP-dependent helicase/nuclease subunit B